MIPMSEQHKTVLRDNLLSLAVQCPMERANPVDCPLFDVRKLDPSKGRQWFKGLTRDDLVYLNAYHCVCAQLRMESRLPGFGS